MNVSIPYRFSVEAVRLSGEPLGDYPLDAIDFEPMLRAAHLMQMRRGTVKVSSRLPRARIVPIACEDRGRPFVGGIEVRFDDVADTVTFSVSRLHGDVVGGSRLLVDRGVIRSGEQFGYSVCAFPAPEESPVETDFDLEEAVDRLIVWRASLPPTEHHHGGGDGEADLPVLFRRNVLDEAVALSRSAGEVEMGGLLLGHLCLDPEIGELFLEVVALVAATEAIGTEASLRFNPDTFAHLERVLALRNQDECMVGWFHSHPHFCRLCPESRRQHCDYGRAFFSQADRDVHRTLFPQAYSQALLISDLGGRQPVVDLFSWRDGVIEPRRFDITDIPLTRHSEQPMAIG